MVDNGRRRFGGHVLRPPSARPVSAAAQWTPEGGKKEEADLKKTWQDTLRDDLQAMDDSWEEAKSVAGDRKEWRAVVTLEHWMTNDLHSLRSPATDLASS